MLCDLLQVVQFLQLRNRAPKVLGLSFLSGQKIRCQSVNRDLVTFWVKNSYVHPEISSHFALILNYRNGNSTDPRPNNAPTLCMITSRNIHPKNYTFKKKLLENHTILRYIIWCNPKNRWVVIKRPTKKPTQNFTEPDRGTGPGWSFWLKAPWVAASLHSVDSSGLLVLQEGWFCWLCWNINSLTFCKAKDELNIPDFSKKNIPTTIHIWYSISTYCTLIPSKYATFMWVNISFPWIFGGFHLHLPHIFNPHLPSQRLMNSHRRGLRVPPRVETAAKNPRFILAKGVNPPPARSDFLCLQNIRVQKKQQTPKFLHLRNGRWDQWFCRYAGHRKSPKSCHPTHFLNFPPTEIIQTCEKVQQTP